MSGHVLKWVGGALTAGAAVGMGVYFHRVGLEQADQSASMIGAFIGLAGLALALHGTLTARRTGPASTSVVDAAAALDHATTGKPDLGGVQNEIGGGTFHGPVIQGRDISHTTFGSSESSTSHSAPPQPPAAPAVGQ
ncbi:hypothetical protein ACIBLB_35675 [Streptosporangium canum]|uniref:hypothetical protein n=1 Tax=Streptosporangium canum TaxID=324952 RepID=UPI0037A4ED59